MAMLALSAPPLAGKSTLARHLRDHYGYVLADHSLTLIRSYATEYGLSIDEVYQNKEYHRLGLQEHGYQIGFNDASRAGRWLERTLNVSGWRETPLGTGIVFDSIRGPVQEEYARDRGFIIVNLFLTEGGRMLRAQTMGSDYRVIKRAMERHPELESGSEHPDIMLFGHATVEDLAMELSRRVLRHG